MKVLIVCSGNYENFDFQKNQAFIYDQIIAVEKASPEITFNSYFVKGKGLIGYLKNIPKLHEALRSSEPEIIHAHGGVLGLLCCLQRKVPVLCTLHGSDVNLPLLNIISSIVGLLARNLIFVSENLKNKLYLKFPEKSNLIPCGVDLDLFQYHKPNERITLDIKQKILFASAFSNPVKNFSLAHEALNNLDHDVEIYELKGRNRKEVCDLLNSADLLLLTSFTEGSPQVIKEAMACNCPIVSTKVGDVNKVIGNTKGCFTCSFDPQDVAEKIKLALDFSLHQGRTNGRQRIIELGLDSENIAKRIIEVYKKH